MGDKLTVKLESQTNFLVLIIVHLRRELFIRLGMKFDFHERNRPSNFLFTSSKGTPWTLPDLSSRRRRSISVSQAACTSSSDSISVSERSSNIRASLSLSACGSSAASRATSVSVLGIIYVG